MTAHHFHAVIWIDHREARVFHFNPTEVEKLVIHPDHPTKHVHQQSSKDEHAYFHATAEAIADAGAVLVVGPAHTKTDFVKYFEQHHPKLKSIIAGVETVDHPSDGQVVAFARKYLKVTDRVTPQIV
ncbi:stalled ribosome rescue protein Dom34 [Rhodopseudomonas rhenobacensis]|uniref:Stalled ribosome rescue protein Dom34 n=1 Tax=Rhodopseudomonas rhenobacensis TaxID=87461 RepID=A0A7W7Z3J9_9BRAD|nr:translational machinery protein [Rhodopseudomonas rhenobacensis]MBB5047395.1 stalled ribosome rescue protein Dom34 [Rhodopseudomonas rhenobacensis]